MINDKVRTASYAKFILSNQEVFKDAVVMDVGCGTGILSLFAVKAGAKRVFAIDASDIAERAEKIVKDNELENFITYALETPGYSGIPADNDSLVSSVARSRTSTCPRASTRSTSSSPNGWVMPCYTSRCWTRYLLLETASSVPMVSWLQARLR